MYNALKAAVDDNMDRAAEVMELFAYKVLTTYADDEEEKGPTPRGRKSTRQESPEFSFRLSSKVPNLSRGPLKDIAVDFKSRMRGIGDNLMKDLVFILQTKEMRHLKEKERSDALRNNVRDFFKDEVVEMRSSWQRMFETNSPQGGSSFASTIKKEPTFKVKTEKDDDDSYIPGKRRKELKEELMAKSNRGGKDVECYEIEDNGQCIPFSRSQKPISLQINIGAGSSSAKGETIGGIESKRLQKNTDRSEERNDLLREKLREYFDEQYNSCQLCPFETLDNRFFDEHCQKKHSKEEWKALSDRDNQHGTNSSLSNTRKSDKEPENKKPKVEESGDAKSTEEKTEGKEDAERLKEDDEKKEEAEAAKGKKT